MVMVSIKTIAAAAAAAAALSGCGNSGGDASSESAVAAPTVLERVPADQIPAPTTTPTHERPQDGGVRPGAAIAEGDTYCTAGWVLPGADGVPVVITAAHCATGGKGRVRARGGNDFGVWAAAWAAPPAGLGDTAALRMTLGPQPAADAGTVAGHHIRGMLASDEVQKLQAGTEVCMLGSVSGARCGALVIAHTGAVVVDIGDSVASGDSGGPVWVLDRNGDAVILGVVSQGSGDLLRVALAAPIIEAYDLKPPQR